MPAPVDIVIGIDIGLTSIKVASFDRTGEMTSCARRSTATTSAPGGVHEIDMEELWSRVSAALCELLDVQPGPWRLTSIGVTGHGNGLYPIDASGRPAGAAITSSDTRAAALVNGLPASTREALRASTGSFPWAGQPLVLLAWLRAYKPDIYAATATILGCKDWVRYCLTGLAAMDRTDASASGLLSHDHSSYAKDAAELLGLPDATFAALPTLLESDAVAGTVTDAAAAATRLPAGTPVAAGCLDCVAAVVAVDGVHQGDTTLIVGTWAISAVASKPLPDLADILMAVPLPGGSPHVLCLNSAPTSGGALDWVLSTLGMDQQAAFNAAELVDAGTGGLVFLPFIHGLPEVPSARGAFIGLQASHTPGHLVRATLEGIAHYYRQQILQHIRSGALPTSRPYRLIGGGARSSLWAQIFADVLGHPVAKVDSDQLGARGAALLAVEAIGDTSFSAHLRTHPGLALERVDPRAESREAIEQAANFDRWYSAATGNSTASMPE